MGLPLPPSRGRGYRDRARDRRPPGGPCRSDPAVDLSVARSSLDEARRPAFFAAYGEVAEETRIRARVVAASLCAMLADWAAKEEVPVVLDAAVAGLRRAIDED